MFREHLLKVRGAYHDYYPRFSDAEYERRYIAIRDLMEEAEVECLLIYGDSGHCYMNMANIRYVSNYADHQYSYVVFPVVGEPTLFTSIQNMQPGAMAMSVIEDVRWSVGSKRETGAMVGHRMAEFIDNAKRIGVVGPDAERMASIPHHHYETLRQVLPQAQFVNLTKEFEAIRRIPSAEEIEWIKKGADFTDQAMEALVDAVRPGAREFELYGACHSAYLPKGGTLMFSIMGTGSMREPSMPHPFAWPSERQLREGDIVVAEISASYYGYAGQIIRAIALGPPPPEYEQLFELARKVYQETAAALKPGSTEDDILAVTAQIPEAGYTSLAPVIHGWGLGLCWPYIGIPGSEGWASTGVEFQEDMTLMIEPHICAPDLAHGLMLGNLCRVRSDGAESYQQFPLEFVVK